MELIKYMSITQELPEEVIIGRMVLQHGEMLIHQLLNSTDSDKLNQLLRKEN